MDSPGPKLEGFSFSGDQVRQLLGSAEGKQLLALLNRDGGTALRKAASALKNGDEAQARQAVAPLMQTAEADALIRKLQEKRG